MSILAENWLFLLILALFVALHLLGGRRGRVAKGMNLDHQGSEGEPDRRQRRIDAAGQSPKWDGRVTPIGSNAPTAPFGERREP